jgi:hypothetical protein
MSANLLERTAEVAQGYTIGPLGLRILRELTQTEWALLGKTIRSRIEGAQWALGDWLLYGGRDANRAEGGAPRDADGQFTSNGWMGNGYARAAEITGYSVAYLSAVYAAANAFPPDNRDPAVCWTIYARLAHRKPDDRVFLLAKAKAERWSVRDLEAYVARQLGDVSFTSRSIANRRPDALPHTRKQLHVKCPKCDHVFPVKAHRVDRS